MEKNCCFLLLFCGIAIHPRLFRQNNKQGNSKQLDKPTELNQAQQQILIAEAVTKYKNVTKQAYIDFEYGRSLICSFSY